MFSSEYPPCWGGVGKHVQNLCRRLQPYVNLRLVTATYGRPVEQFEINNLARLRVRSFPLLLAQYLSGLRLERLNQMGLIHIHVPHAFLPRDAKRIVSTSHVVWAEYSEALRYQRPISIFDIQLAGMNQQLIKTEKKLASVSDAVIAVSKSVKDELVARYNLAPERVHVIHNGVDIGQFQPSHERRNTFLYIGRQTAHKGLPYLLQAFAKFVRTHEEYELVLMGERLEGGVDPSLIQLSQELGVGDKVKFTGRLPDSKAWRILGRARCLVLPSLVEGFPMTVLEAMASETPLIATNVGGIPEVVQNDRNGLLVPPADPNALVKSMERIAADARLRLRLVEAGKRTCRGFSWEKVARKTLEVYSQVCSR